MKSSNKSILVTLAVSVSLFGISGVVIAHSSHINSGGYRSSTVSDLRYVISDAPSTYATNIIKPAASKWNEITSKVNLSYNSTGSSLSVFYSLRGGDQTYGANYKYKYSNGFLVEASLTDIWDITDVYGFENQMEKYGFSDPERISNFAHEFGHSLSLKDISKSDSYHTGSIL